MSRRRRTLRPEEEALWQAVARTAVPMHAKAAVPVDHQLVENLPPVIHVEQPSKPAIPKFSLGQKAHKTRDHDIMPGLAERLAAAPLRMDAKAFGRMTRGKLSPEARIDLHGMTLAEAHPELIRFVLNAHADGLRLVLVITGKGKDRDDGGPIPQRFGVLRHQVPVWLRQMPLAAVVLQTAEAHLKHGGGGAYYVYLRRGR
jgi:DNA-nicking Smr family endonuclease